MGWPQPVTVMPVAEFINWENQQATRHEYFQGEIFAMSGAARRHVTVALNMGVELYRALEDTPCRVYLSDMKVIAPGNQHEQDACFYPDVQVTCDAADHQAEYAMQSPILIVEVLSPSTAAFDRGDKFAAYRRIPSLKEYILIDPDQQSIDVFQRCTEGDWLLRDITPQQPLRLKSLDLEIAWSRVFRNVNG